MEQPAETSDLLGEPIEKRARLVKAPITTFVKYRLSGYIYEIKPVKCIGEDEDFYYQKQNRISKVVSPFNKHHQYFDSWEEARTAMLERAEKTVERLKKETKALEKKISKIKEMVKP